MKITALTVQQKNKNRVNVMVDGTYRFSLDVYQVGELGVRVGKEYTDEELESLQNEGDFGKLYARALDYCLSRPHSAKEVRDYLHKKTLDTRTKTGDTKKGSSPLLTQRVFDRLSEKGYINDEHFARYWIENRNIRKGVSRRKLALELRTKGVSDEYVQIALNMTSRSEDEELRKVIAKKRNHYSDNQQFIQYLVRQGFTFDTVKRALDQ